MIDVTCHSIDLTIAVRPAALPAGMRLWWNSSSLTEAVMRPPLVVSESSLYRLDFRCVQIKSGKFHRYEETGRRRLQ